MTAAATVEAAAARVRLVQEEQELPDKVLMEAQQSTPTRSQTAAAVVVEQ